MNNPPSNAPPLQERILDAVERCFTRYGIQKTTVGDVAKEVGVSRMTVYRQFKDRNALFRGAVFRNINRHWQQIADALIDIDNLGEWLVEAIIYYWREITGDAATQLYNELDAFDKGLEAALTAEGLEVAASRFRHLYAQANAEQRVAEGLSAEDIAEWIHRTNHSLCTLPGNRLNSEDKLRSWLAAQVIGGMVKSQ